MDRVLASVRRLPPAQLVVVAAAPDIQRAPQIQPMALNHQLNIIVVLNTRQYPTFMSHSIMLTALPGLVSNTHNS